MKFTAAVLTQTGHPLSIVDNISLPGLRTGQVLVKIHYTGICFSQLMEVAGKRGPDKYLPHMLGHEATAEVIDIGKGVTKVKAGDRVVLGWLKGSGLDVSGAKYDSPIGTINSGSVTTFGEYSIVSENRCYLLPECLSMHTGLLFGCALPTGMGMVQNQLHYQPSSFVGVFGLGGIGMSALMAILQNPPAKIVVFDTSLGKLDLALSLGADIAINTLKTDWRSELSDKTHGKNVDFIIESAGSCQTIEMAFSALNKTGKCIFASHPSAGHTISIDPFELICGKQIEGSWGGQADPELILSSQAPKTKTSQLEKLLSSPYTLNQINQAMADLVDNRVIRAIVKVID